MDCPGTPLPRFLRDGADEAQVLCRGKWRTDQVQGHVIMTTPGLRSMSTPWAVVV